MSITLRAQLDAAGLGHSYRSANAERIEAALAAGAKLNPSPKVSRCRSRIGQWLPFLARVGVKERTAAQLR